jgi:Tol biopolymer transport system component
MASRDSSSGSEEQRPEPILAELEKVLADERFATSPSLTRFLRYAVAETLAGRTDGLKESVLGSMVFERREDFDPRLDPIVRVQAGKLRAKLRDYFEQEGAADPIRIEFPKGSYVPRFSRKPEPRDDARALPVSRWTKRRLALGAAAAAGAAVIFLAVWTMIQARRAAPPAGATALTRLTYDAGSSMFPVISRDGRLLAYSSDRGKGDLNIWVQPVRGGEPVQLTRHEATDLSPDFSPDSTWIAFRSHRDGGGIYVVSIPGGEERKLAGKGWLPRYSPDGAWIAYLGAGTLPGSAIYVAPSGGGQPREVFTAEIEILTAPIWTPDGKDLLFLGAPRHAPAPLRERDWYVAPLAGGRPARAGLREQLLAQGLPAPDIEAPPGDWLGTSVVFTLRRSTTANIWKIPIDARTWRVSGPATQLTSGSGVEAFPRCSAAGRMVFASEFQLTHIFSLAVNARTGKAAGAPQQLTADSSLTPQAAIPRISADGTKLAYASSRSGRDAVLIKDLASGKETALAAQRDSGPLISADGSMVVYGSREQDKEGVYVVEPSQPFARKVCDSCGPLHDWSRDKRRILCETPSRSALLVWDWDSGKPTEWLKYPPRALLQASLSADRRWVAMVFREPAGGVVAPLTEAAASPANFVQVTADPNIASLHWSPDGNLLYYFSHRDDYRCLWAQRLEPATRRPAGPPFPVHHFHSNRLSPWNSWISVSEERLVFALTEPRANVWMATLSGAEVPAESPGLR